MKILFYINFLVISKGKRWKTMLSSHRIFFFFCPDFQEKIKATADLQESKEKGGGVSLFLSSISTCSQTLKYWLAFMHLRCLTRTFNSRLLPDIYLPMGIGIWLKVPLFCLLMQCLILLSDSHTAGLNSHLLSP